MDLMRLFTYKILVVISNYYISLRNNPDLAGMPTYRLWTPPPRGKQHAKAASNQFTSRITPISTCIYQYYDLEDSAKHHNLDG